MRKEFEKFLISQSALLIRDEKCLILKFSDIDKWGLPGGRIDKGEESEPALRREMKEELGFEKFDIIGVADYDIWYFQKKDGEIHAVCGIVNLIKSEENELKLSHEHSEAKWVAESEVMEYDFIWPNVKRMIKKGFVLNRLLEKNEKNI